MSRTNFPHSTTHNLQFLTKYILPLHYLIITYNYVVANLHFRYGKQINSSNISFNAGVLGINLDKWREKNLTKEVIYWMSENKKKPLWDLGTQPIIHVLSYGDCKFVNWRWNVDKLGRKDQISAERVSKAYILHWNGLGKEVHVYCM